MASEIALHTHFRELTPQEVASVPKLEELVEQSDYRYATTNFIPFAFAKRDGTKWQASVPKGFLCDGASFFLWPDTANEDGWGPHDYLYALHYIGELTRDRELADDVLDNKVMEAGLDAAWWIANKSYRTSGARGAHFLVNRQLFNAKLRWHGGKYRVTWTHVQTGDTLSAPPAAIGYKAPTLRSNL